MVGKSFQVMFSGTAMQRLREITAYVTEYSNSKAVGRHVRRGILSEAKKLEKLPASKPTLPSTEEYDYKVYYTKAWEYKIIFRILTSRDIVRILTIRHDKELDENVRKDF